MVVNTILLMPHALIWTYLVAMGANVGRTSGFFWLMGCTIVPTNNPSQSPNYPVTYMMPTFN